MNKNMNESHKHDFQAEELLVPNSDKTDANRLFLFGHHFSQCADLASPEKPLVFTNFEKQFGKYSDLGYYDTESDIEILAKINKNKNSYYLVVHDIDNDKFDVIERREEFWLTESYGFTNNNSVIDSVKVGDIVNKGTRLYKNHNYDENDNFMYGVNLNVAFYTDKTKTLEDALTISKSGADKLKSYKVVKVKVIVNQNDLLLNLNTEDDDIYKAFPDIGDEVKNFVCVRRRINFKEIYNYDDLTINSLTSSDQPFFGKGKVIDINIYNNMDEKDLKGKYNNQVRSLLNKRKSFNKEMFKVLDPIIQTDKENCTPELIKLYNSVSMELTKVPFSTEGSKFNGYVLEFILLKENKLSIGSKVSGRYGNKSVISQIKDSNESDNYSNENDINDYGMKIKIVPDNEMPVVEEGPFKGLRAEVLTNPLGVTGRLNISQNYEHELNFISMHISNKIKESSSLQEKENWYFNYIKDVNEKQYEFELNWYNKLSDDDKELFMKEAESTIYLHQESFFNDMDFDHISRLYEKYNFVKPFKVKNIPIPLIIAPMYYMKLKHDLIIKYKGSCINLFNCWNLFISY